MTTPEDQPDYTLQPFGQQVHDKRRGAEIIGLDEDTQRGLRGGLVGSVLQIVGQALTGVLIPGPLKDIMEGIGDWAADIPILGPLLEWLASLFGIDIGDVGDPEFGDFGGIWEGVTDIFIKPLGKFADLVGGLIQGIQIPILDPTKILNLPGLFNNVLGGFKGIFNGIFGGGASTATTIEEAIAEAETAAALTVSPNNPAVVDLAGRVAVVENAAGGNSWSEGMDSSTLTPHYTILSGSINVGNTDGTPDWIRAATASTAVLQYTHKQFMTAQQYTQIRLRDIESGDNGLVLMADSTCTTFVALYWYDQAFTSANNIIRIVSSTGGVGAAVTRDEYNIGRTWKINDVLGIGYSEETETYIAYLNDIPVCDWPDPGAAVIPITGRYSHLLLNRNGGFSGNRGPGIDNHIGYDWI